MPSRFAKELGRSPLRVAPRVLASVIRERLPAASRPAVSFAGGYIEADLKTAQGRGFYRYRSFDPSLSLVTRLLRPGDVFIDAGANIGQFTLAGARCIGGTGRVWSFEASPSTVERLRRNVSLNRYHWVRVEQVALDEVQGEASFVSFDGTGDGLSSFAPASTAGGTSAVIPTQRLDEIVPPEDDARVALVKIDVEGAELKLLRGAERVLANSLCAVLIEIEPDHLGRQGATVSEVEALLNRHGLLEQPDAAAPPNRLFVRGKHA